MPIRRDCVDVVVHQALKCIEAARSGGIQEGQTSGSSDRKSIAEWNDIGDVLCDQPLALSKYLPPRGTGVEQDQPIRSCHSRAILCNPRQHTVDAEHVLIFYMAGRLAVRLKNVQPAIKVPDPQPAKPVHRKCGNIAVSKHSSRWF